MNKVHSFHIPVMGIAFTLDSPVKVAHYGIDSVISLVDDILMEKMREMYALKYQYSFEPISNKVADFRALRITAYLNLIQEIANKKFEEVKKSYYSTSEDLKRYFNLLPKKSELKEAFVNLLAANTEKKTMQSWLDDNLYMGAIDVNIMTKVDKENYLNKEKLPTEFNDAHAALRGFAQSNLNTSIVLSAGMSPRLYSYFEQFEDFYPDENGNLKKKVILKVSDYRSALIQGKFMAKKGIWISEYRVESGLNCGGHAFATDGFLMGPILEEFKQNRAALNASVYELYLSALKQKNKALPNKELKIKITAQGGVGTAKEHDFLLHYYGLDAVGWGTPFLLVPEATVVDNATLLRLIAAKEEDLYLSNISPLGVPFNSLRSNTKDEEKVGLIQKGRPGSSCPKKFLALNHEFDEKDMCTASREYQHLKIKELESANLSKGDYQIKYDGIVEKSCLCVGLGTAALLVNELDTKKEGQGVSICPGPNIAYFSHLFTLDEMIGHIYGKTNIIDRTDRPNLFIKELGIYIDYIEEKLEKYKLLINNNEEVYISTFTSNLLAGIKYYQNSIPLLECSDDLRIIEAELQLSKSEHRIIEIRNELALISTSSKN
jgi:hypothetical protein